MATAKKKSSKNPSPAQLRARRAFVKMAKQRAKDARARKRLAGPTRRPTAKRNSAKRPATKRATSSKKRSTSTKKNPVSCIKNGRRIYGAAAANVIAKRNGTKRPAPKKRATKKAVNKSRRRNSSTPDATHTQLVHRYFRGGGLSQWKDAEKRGQQRLFSMNGLIKKRLSRRINGKTFFLIPLNKRRNPSTGELYSDFQGRESQQTLAMPVSDFAPADLYLLGDLATLETKSQKYSFDPGEAALVADKGNNMWIAGEVRLDPNVDLGPLEKLSYVTVKDHINSGQEIEYVHTLGEEGGELPNLCTDREGLLLIEGGDYSISPDGIVN